MPAILPAARMGSACADGAIFCTRASNEHSGGTLPMTMLLAAAAVFLGIHVLISGTRVRDAITGAIGEGAYMGLFSLASLAASVWLVIAYNHANSSVDDRELYSLGIGVKHLAIPVVALA